MKPQRSTVTRSDKLAIIVHGNDEVTVRDERKHPVVCVDCRFAGWLTEYEFRRNDLPFTCLLYSGGADPLDGDRVVFDHVEDRGWRPGDPYKRDGYTYKRKTWYGHELTARDHRTNYPRCFDKNPKGECPDFVRAQQPTEEPRWWQWRKRRRLRRKMRG